MSWKDKIKWENVSWGVSNWRDWVIILLAILLMLHVLFVSGDCRDIVEQLNEDPCFYCEQLPINNYEGDVPAGVLRDVTNYTEVV